MNEEIRKYLQDILKSIDAIDFHFHGKKYFTEFQKNITVKRAIEREFEIIGEATNRINKMDSSIVISSLKGIIGLRNFIVHAYDSVDDNYLWAIIINHLPTLKNEVDELLKQ